MRADILITQITQAAADTLYVTLKFRCATDDFAGCHALTPQASEHDECSQPPRMLTPLRVESMAPGDPSHYAEWTNR